MSAKVLLSRPGGRRTALPLIAVMTACAVAKAAIAIFTFGPSRLAQEAAG
ncbi:hypothetical protein [Rhizobium sp. WL3]|jgi:hypothetical protein|nr:hypothetical protein [Rhizobium sp. WL3]